jgi:cell division protein YceG involved in septum cleavage
MADTIITNTPDKGSGDSGAGWAVAVVILIAVVVGGIILYKKGAFRSNPSSNGTNINVTIPAGSNSSESGAAY